MLLVEANKHSVFSLLIVSDKALLSYTRAHPFLSIFRFFLLNQSAELFCYALGDLRYASIKKTWWICKCWWTFVVGLLSTIALQ